MRIVLDTHAWVRWIAETESLAPAILASISTASDVLVSSISCWEVAYLTKRGRLSLPMPMDAWMKAATVGSNIAVVSISQEIAVASANLPDVHRDPADRIIIATALVLDAQLVSFDSRFGAYDGLRGRLLGMEQGVRSKEQGAEGIA